MSALSLPTNPIFHSRSKHVELDVRFVHDKVLAKEIDTWYAPSSDQLTNGITKPLNEHKFLPLKHKLGIISSPSSLRGVKIYSL